MMREAEVRFRQLPGRSDVSSGERKSAVGVLGARRDSRQLVCRNNGISDGARREGLWQRADMMGSGWNSGALGTHTRFQGKLNAQGTNTM